MGTPPFVDESPRESAEEIVWRKKGPTLQRQVARLAKENARLKAANGQAAHRTTPSAAKQPEWPEPDRSLADSDRIAAPPFDTSVFSPALLEWAARTAEDCSAPIDYIAGNLIGSASAVIGNARRVSPWPGWVEHPILWIALVGPPSANKTPSLRPFKNALRHLERDISSGHDDAMRRWEGQREEAAAREKTWQEEVKTAVKQHKAPPDKPSDAEPPGQPAPPRLLTVDASTEEAQNVLSENPRGLTLMRSELSGWLGQLDRYGGSGADRAFYLECWDGDPHTVDRVKYEGDPVQIPYCSIAIIGGFVPVRLRAVLSGPDDGLAERFLYLWPDPVPPRRPNSRDALARETLLTRIFDKLRGLDWDRDPRGSPIPKTIRVSEQGLLILDAMRNEIGAANHDPNILASWRGKNPGRLLRTALTLEFLEWAARDSDDPEPALVSLAAMRCAADYIDYCDAMMHRCLGLLAIPVEERLLAQTARLILAEKFSAIGERDLYRRPGFSALRNNDRRNRLALALEGAGWIRRQIVTASQGNHPGGRSSPTWIVNPQLTVER